MSVSETPDLAVLGMLEGEDKLFLGAVLTPLVHSEARIAYGGRIEHPGSINFTLEISGQLSESYRRMDTALGKRPIIQYLRSQDAQNAGSEKLFNLLPGLDWVFVSGVFASQKLKRDDPVGISIRSQRCTCGVEL